MKRFSEASGEAPARGDQSIRFTSVPRVRGWPPLLSVFCLFFFFRSVAQADLPLPEDSFPLLNEVLREAGIGSSRMIEERLRAEEAEAETDIYSAGRYPSVSGNFRYLGRLEDRNDFDHTRSFYQPQAALTVRQPLYHWDALQANHRIGQLRAALAENNRAEVYRVLLLSIRETFLNLAVQQKAIDLARERVELAQRELSVAEAEFERGGISRDALRERELAVMEVRLEMERARREQEFSRKEFLQLTGFEPPGDDWAPSEVPPVALAGEAVIKDWGQAGQEKGYRPWEVLSRLRIRQAEEQVAVESVRRRPQLDLVAGVAQDQVAVFDRADIDRTVYFAGIQVTWNLFDGHESRGRKAAALARKRLELRRHSRLAKEAEAEVERLTKEMGWAGRELTLLEERLELARRNLSQLEEDFERGLASEADVAAAQVVQSERELAANRGRADYLMAAAELLSVSGADPAMDGIWINRDSTRISKQSEGGLGRD